MKLNKSRQKTKNYTVLLKSEYSDSNPLFCNNVIVEDGKPVGMISYWDMGDFYYIEHFAIDPSLRNGGYGKRVLESIQTKLQGPIVLEVEEPTEEMRIRRINFYKRLNRYGKRL